MTEVSTYKLLRINYLREILSKLLILGYRWYGFNPLYNAGAYDETSQHDAEKGSARYLCHRL